MLHLERNTNFFEYLSVQGMVFFAGLIVAALYMNVALDHRTSVALDGRTNFASSAPNASAVSVRLSAR